MVVKSENGTTLACTYALFFARDRSRENYIVMTFAYENLNIFMWARLAP